MAQDHQAHAQPPLLRHAIRDLTIASVRAGNRLEARRRELRWIAPIGLAAAATWTFAISDGPGGLRVLAWALGLLAIGSFVSSLVTARRRR